MAKRKLDIYTDESVPEEIVLALASSHRVYDARQLGHIGRDDEFHHQFAKDNKLILVTCDSRYFNERRFPVHLTRGIVVIPSNLSKMAVALKRIIEVLELLYEIDLGFDRFKLSAQSDGFMWRQIDYEGKIIEYLHKYEEPIEELEEEE